MRVTVIATILALVISGTTDVTPSAAQQTASDDGAPALYASATDVASALAKAKKEWRQGQPFVSERILQMPPYTIEIQYRPAVPQPAVVRDDFAEMIIVEDGSGTLLTGGKLVNEKRMGTGASSGTAIEGGKSRRIAPGDQFFLPNSTPVWFSEIDESLVLLSLHLPRPVRPCCVYLGQMGWVPNAGVTAQTSNQNSTPDTTYISGSDVDALLAKLKDDVSNTAAGKDRGVATAPIVQLIPYTSHIEYRVHRRPQEWLWHGSEAEVFFIMDGSATLLTGGKLVAGKRTDMDNRAGTGDEGGVTRILKKGDIVMIPDQSPHGFSAFNPGIVLRSIHVPLGANF
jgi:mannose-6-phosphate isomerase-like protein (cupin superfamily)